MQRVPLTGNYGTVAMIRPVLGLMTAADPQSAKTNPRSAPRTIPRAMTRKEIVVEATGLSGAYVVSEANRLVEAAGIEPASEDRSMQASTCVVRGLILPPGFPTDWTPEGTPQKISPER
jgi:hypothetical protein